MTTTPGAWWLWSKSDPRWNSQGEGLVGGWVIPPDAKRRIEELKVELGCEPPNDLEYEYVKDSDPTQD